MYHAKTTFKFKHRSLPNRFLMFFLPSPFFKFAFALLIKQSFRGQLNKQRLVFRIELLKEALILIKTPLMDFVSMASL